MFGSLVECYRDNINYSILIFMLFMIECLSKIRIIVFYINKLSFWDGSEVFLEICEVKIYGMFV